MRHDEQLQAWSFQAPPPPPPPLLCDGMRAADAAAAGVKLCFQLLEQKSGNVLRNDPPVHHLAPKLNTPPLRLVITEKS
jgi:hypothetical protein